MNIEFYEGFTFYKKDEGPVYLTLHSGPAIETPTSRDDNSDTVASLCWLKTGGSLVLVNLPRKRLLGIDFNRDIPPLQKALKYWPAFEKGSSPVLMRYRKRYAWVAKSPIDYSERLKIYNKFWFQAKNLGNFFISMHRKFARLKNFPSIMDISSFEGQGINKEIIIKIIEDVNLEYKDFFKTIEKDYKEAVLLEERRALKRIFEINKNVTLKEILSTRSDFHENLKKDLLMIQKYASKSFYKRLYNKFDLRNFLMAGRNALNKTGPPTITFENIFRNELSYAPRKKLYLGKDKIILEIECNQFINYWYPQVAADIITKIVENVKKVEMYRKLGHKQTEIIKFLGEKDGNTGPQA